MLPATLEPTTSRAEDYTSLSIKMQQHIIGVRFVTLVDTHMRYTFTSMVLFLEVVSRSTILVIGTLDTIILLASAGFTSMLLFVPIFAA
ncbi:hypothetical protein Tco_0837799 [Tanacetum coccineum]